MTTAAAAGVRTVVVGATGRMGGQLLRLIGQFPGLRLHGAVTHPGGTALGEDTGALVGMDPTGIRVSSDLPALLPSAQLVIDFSHPSSTPAHVEACAAARVPLLIGTTGLSPGLGDTLTRAARTIPLLVAANTSLGVSVLLDLVRQAAQALPAGFDIEILEVHHRGKRDAPSGTALALGAAAAEGRRVLFVEQATYRPPGLGPPRTDEQIGMSVVRGGDVVGEHEVWFLGPGERVQLRHVATDRGVFARGALRAGAWLVGQPPGRYSMSDIFSIRNR